MTEITPEFSRILSVSRLPPNGVEENLQAKPDERQALAKRFALLDLPLLQANLVVKPTSQRNIEATGTIKADIIQQCVVTLEPLPVHMELEVDILFIPEGENQEGSGSPFADELEEEIETFSNGKIDLGEMVAQHLGANIDLYPRKAEATLPVMTFGAEEKKLQPFAQLAQAVKDVKNKDKTKG